MDDATSTAKLVRQRHQVQDVAATLEAAVQRRWPGEVMAGAGRYRPCRSSGPNTFESFQFEYTGRFEPAPGTTVSLTALTGDDVPVFGEVVAIPGAQRVTGVAPPVEGGDEQIDVTVDHRIDGPTQWLVLAVRGACVEVPPERSDYWLTEADG
ncbi:hypothetical protein [Nocardioides sp. R-C-SC26]|uniref:hypothetical protein n=1 Tax=Nocardioides sp. R-C-SC26 TaxID=2870414 RepID=UPI001E5F6AD9|nr:hypothetical protein [Nocardioides sp. R-C-SC26]